MRRAAGFTLLEVVIAFAIATVALSALMHVFGSGMKNAAISDEFSRAAMVPESQLALVGVNLPLQEGVQQGELEEGRYRWTLEVKPYVVPGSDLAAQASADTAQMTTPFRLMDVVLIVTWEDGKRQVRLDTQRLAPK